MAKLHRSIEAEEDDYLTLYEVLEFLSGLPADAVFIDVANGYIRKMEYEPGVWDSYNARNGVVRVW